MEAVAGDEEWAERIVHHPPAKAPPRQRLSEWSPEMERLTDVYDRLGELIRVVLATSTRKRPKKIPPAPRPTTALERVRNRMREQKHRSIVARVLPHKAADT